METYRILFGKRSGEMRKNRSGCFFILGRICSEAQALPRKRDAGTDRTSPAYVQGASLQSGDTERGI